MRPPTETAIGGWYSRVLGATADELWRTVTVRPHGSLGDYAGWYVVWRAAGVHVSAPAGADPALVDLVLTTPIDRLQSEQHWVAFAHRLGLQVIGPATHSYLDADPGPVDEVFDLDAGAREALRTQVSAADWEESGWADAPPHAFGLLERGRPVAAANLNPTLGVARDIGVLVVPGHRGRGLAHLVGRHAASYAIRAHGFARWGARDTNLGSRATAARLGFEPYATQLAIRP